MAARHAPTISFTSSLDCDAIVRTSTSFATARELVAHALCTHSQLQHLQLVSANEAPPLGLHATHALHSALESAPDDVAAVNAFADALETVTAVARHAHLRDPVISLHASWAAQPGFAPPPAHHDDSHLLLFVRTASRHDDAALSNALPVSLDHLGHDRVHVVRLPQRHRNQQAQKADEQDNQNQLRDDGHDEVTGNESIAAVVVRIVDLVRKLADRRTENAAAAVDRARRASRTSFRSWLLGTASTQSPLLLHDDLSSSLVSASTKSIRDATSKSATSATVNPSPMSYASSSTSSMLPSSPSRRGSFSAALQAPQFDPSSPESLARQHADYAFVAARYGEAADAYAQLALDCRSLTGLAAVHEASAHEMTGLSRAMIHAPPLAVTPSFERAITTYARAVRPELAVRVAFRAAALLTPNSLEQASNFLIRARDAIAPATGATTSATGSAFVDSALAVIAIKCAHLALLNSPKYSRSKSQPPSRRASMYAFIAMTRLSALGYDRLAGRLADLVTPSAILGRPAVAHHISLAHANAAAANRNVGQALALFSSALLLVSEETDVELEGATVRSFIRFVGDGISHRLTSNWESGAPFPLISEKEARVITADHNPDELATEKDDWARLEDDVLEDWEWAKQVSQNKPAAKRERRSETIVSNLRRELSNNHQQQRKNIGGSLEMKIRRVREVAHSRRLAIRERSLLARSAVVGEPVVLRVTITNPLQFPIFVDDVCPVVTLDGRLHFRHSFDSEPNLNSNSISISSKPSNQDSEKSNSEPKEEITIIPLNGVVLKPVASQTLDLHVVPNVAGNLRFVGVTWRFTIGMGSASPRSSSAVPGFGLLNKRGSRLNRTRRQRAADPPIYEEDVSLLLKIIPSAPRMSVVLSHATDWRSDDEQPKSALAGELRRGHLVLKNTGKLPVHHITIRVAPPYDVFVDVLPLTVDVNGSNRLLALGADDFQVNESDAFVSLTTKVNLLPGTTIILPVWMRMSVSTNAFSRRLRNSYGASGEDGCSIPWRAKLAIAYGTNQGRVARAKISANVRCSLSASPRFMRDAEVPSSGSGVLLGIEVEHGGRANVVTRFDVTRISVASCSLWKARPLPAPNVPTGEPPKEIAPSPSSLLINETATVFTFIVRDDSDSEELVRRDWQCHGVSLNEHCIKAEANEKSDLQRAARHFLLCKRHSWQALPAEHDSGEWIFVGVQWRDPSGATGDIHLSPMDPTRWMGRSSTHNIPKTITNGTMSGMSTSTSSTEPPITVQVKHASEVEHDFSQDPLLKRPVTQSNHVFPATVDVSVAITNVSCGLVDVMVSAPPVGGIADGDRGRHWAGDVAISLRSLPPRATRVVNLTAVLAAPGSFNLARFAVVVQSTGFQAARARQSVKIPASFVTVKEKLAGEMKSDVKA